MSIRRILLGAVLIGALAAACSDSDSTEAASTVAPRPSGACDAASADAGQSTQTMTVAGVERSWLQYVPPAVTTGKPLPLVLDIHGYIETPEIHENITRLWELGNAKGFVTVAPRGTGDPLFWDFRVGSNDIAFLRRLIDRVGDDVCIDRARVYATGLSNGAMMASGVACALADRVAAIAPVAGVRDPKDCHPSRPVPVLAIHGTEDQYVMYQGGIGERGEALPGQSDAEMTEDVVDEIIGKDSVPAIVAAWAKRDGCESTRTETKISADVERVSYDCPEGVDVELYRVVGGGHAWPGSPVGPALESLIGKTTMTISANDVMWRFFQRHPLRASSD